MRVWKEKSGVNSTIALAEDLGLVHQDLSVIFNSSYWWQPIQVKGVCLLPL